MIIYFIRWGQVYILDALTYTVPQEVDDAEIMVERVIPRLSHNNSAIIMATVKLIVLLTSYIKRADIAELLLDKVGPPLVTLLSARPEIQYVALRNILLLTQV